MSCERDVIKFYLYIAPLLIEFYINCPHSQINTFYTSKLFLVLILLVRCVCVAIAIQPLVKQPGALITIFFRSDLIALHSFKASLLQQRVLERAGWISEILFKFKVKYLSRSPFHQKRRRH
jgi:hypothetical protein